MRQNLPILITLLVLSLFTVSAVAQDSASALGTSQENACNEGGLFFRDGATLCETEWHWECGWYIANWQNTGEPVPDWCGMGHLAVSTVSAPPAAYIGCQPFFPGLPGQFKYIDFGYSQFLPPGTSVHNTNACNDYTGGMTTPLYIYALSDATALIICSGMGGNTVSLSHPSVANTYTCINS